MLLLAAPCLSWRRKMTRAHGRLGSVRTASRPRGLRTCTHVRGLDEHGAVAAAIVLDTVRERKNNAYQQHTSKQAKKSRFETHRQRSDSILRLCIAKNRTHSDNGAHRSHPRALRVHRVLTGARQSAGVDATTQQHLERIPSASRKSARSSATASPSRRSSLTSKKTLQQLAR